MPSPGGALPETRELRCPYCKSGRTVPVGHVIAVDWTIKEERRCEECQTAFLIVRIAVA
jgi:transcriptional regulator NrdR family protein